MALQGLPYMLFPRPGFGSYYGSGVTIDAAGEKVAAFLQIPRTGQIVAVWWRTQGVTISVPVRVSLQTLGGDGNPSGNYYGGSQPGVQSNPALTTLYRTALGGAASASAGDLIAVVWEFDSSIGNLNIAVDIGTSLNFPTQKFFDGSTWSVIHHGILVALEYNDGTVAHTNTNIWSSAGSYSFNSGSSPNEYALRFKLPFPVKVSGVGRQYRNAPGSFKVRLYIGDTLAAESQELIGGSAGTMLDKVHLLQFNEPVDIPANTVCRASILPTTSSNIDVIFHNVGTGNELLLDAMDGGREFYLSTRTGNGSWTDYTTIRPKLFLLLSAFDNGAGGSGGQKIIPAPILGGF